MIKKFSSPKMRNCEFIFTSKIEYKLVTERGEANQNRLIFPFWCAELDREYTSRPHLSARRRSPRAGHQLACFFC